ncbi:MAG: M24 family metallopeptidase, partial [Saprospiraceae bacterium]|nr:M24 family metallopeptidase [Saprospiraceae bacterium]
YKSKIVSAEDLAIAWLETRSERELQIYPMICRMAHVILRETLSEEIIHPGITTTDDVVWALRQRVADLGLKTWFHPSVSVQRSDMGNNEFLRSFSKRPEKDIIQFGDLVHVDFGITYLRLNTDQQQMFYVLKPGETDVPLGLKKAFANGNRLQDILTSNFTKGRSGNEILKRSLDIAKGEGLNVSIYTHPIGFHGHAAGPTIGMWDKQKGVKGAGDYPLYENTAYSIELFAATEVPEWNGKIVRIMLEEDGVYDGNRFYFLDGRQKEIMTIPGKHQSVSH